MCFITQDSAKKCEQQQRSRSVFLNDRAGQGPSSGQSIAGFSQPGELLIVLFSPNTMLFTVADTSVRGLHPSRL